MRKKNQRFTGRRMMEETWKTHRLGRQLMSKSEVNDISILFYSREATVVLEWGVYVCTHAQTCHGWYTYFPQHFPPFYFQSTLSQSIRFKGKSVTKTRLWFNVIRKGPGL